MLVGFAVAAATLPVVSASAAPLNGVCSGRTPTHVAPSNDGEVMIGTPGDDVMIGGAGDDLIQGLGGRDCIFGGAGNDRLEGGPNNDLIGGGPGRDVIFGGPGRDRMFGDVGHDKIIPGPGDREKIVGGRGNDTLAYSPGFGTLFAGGVGFDTLDFRGTPVPGPTGTAEERYLNLVVDLFIGFFELPDPTQVPLVQEKDGYFWLFEDSSYGAEYRRNLATGNVTSIERVRAHQDRTGQSNIEGDGLANVLLGGPGMDTLKGEAGDDTMSGGNGDDTLLDLEGTNTLNGGRGTDGCFGGAADTLIACESS